jgi:hypothetical protein
MMQKKFKLSFVVLVLIAAALLAVSPARSTGRPCMPMTAIPPNGSLWTTTTHRPVFALPDPMILRKIGRLE